MITAHRAHFCLNEGFTHVISHVESSSWVSHVLYSIHPSAFSDLLYADLLELLFAVVLCLCSRLLSPPVSDFFLVLLYFCCLDPACFVCSTVYKPLAV